MAEPLVIILVLAALGLGALLYLLVIRRRGHMRHRAHADEWDRATSQARALERLRRFEDADHQRPHDGTR